MGLSVAGVGTAPYNMSYGMYGSVSGAAGTGAAQRMLPVGATKAVDGTGKVEESRAAKRAGRAECQTYSR